MMKKAPATTTWWAGGESLFIRPPDKPLVGAFLLTTVD